VIEAADDRYLLPDIWSLFVEPRPDGHGYRPNPKFHTFNARGDRLTNSPLWKGYVNFPEIALMGFKATKVKIEALVISPSLSPECQRTILGLTYRVSHRQQ